MTWFTVIIATIGLAAMTVGFTYAIRLRTKGGVAIYSKAWYTVVFLCAVGGSTMIGALLQPLLSQFFDQ